MSLSNYSFKHAKDLPDIQKTLPKGEINVGLIIDKYSPWKQNKGIEETKIDYIVDILNNSQKNKRISSKRFPLNLYSGYFGRYKDMLNSLRNEGYYIHNFNATLRWRLAINLGDESIYETSISLHRNYSIPIIPGSAVKGCARAWAFNDPKREDTKYEVEKLRQSYDLGENEAKWLLRHSDSYEDAEKKLKIFGSPSVQGNTIFFDALPLIDGRTPDFVTKDIINPHYSSYYRDTSNKTPPGDWMDPNPVVFLDIEKVDFYFTIASKQEDSAELASKFLKGGLTELGLGAKTSSGYGFFLVTV